MLIGTLAKQTNCPIETIRYYEKIGLLSAPPRSNGGQRVYNNQHLRELRFILEARSLDLSLETIGTLLRLNQEPDSPCESVLEIIDKKLDVVNEKIEFFISLKERLNTLAQSCRSSCSSEKNRDCNILDDLDQKRADD